MVHTSFREGISNMDSGTDDAAIFAFSSSSLGWRNLGNNLCASENSRELLENNNKTQKY